MSRVASSKYLGRFHVPPLIQLGPLWREGNCIDAGLVRATNLENLFRPTEFHRIFLRNSLQPFSAPSNAIASLYLPVIILPDASPVLHEQRNYFTRNILLPLRIHFFSAFSECLCFLDAGGSLIFQLWMAKDERSMLKGAF